MKGVVVVFLVGVLAFAFAFAEVGYSAASVAQDKDRQLWASVLPTPESPFSFYHIAKTGGSSLRVILYKAAMKHNLTSVIPCKNRACKCQLNYRLKWNAKDCKGDISDAKASVYAGHFSPNSLAASRGQQFSDNIQCVIIVREPMDRIISHYTYFNVKKFFNETGAHPLRITPSLRIIENLTPFLLLQLPANKTSWTYLWIVPNKP